VKRFQKLEPMRLLAGSLGLAFALLVIGFAVGAYSGAFSWQAAVTAGAALLIVAGGLLYAWRLGAPGRRR
jgi:membrane associated rhomboid family serine protease